MAKRKTPTKDVCPFTGAQFAEVSEGRDGTKIVHTPIFRTPVTLSSDVFQQLPNIRQTQKLGFRRWIAEMIDADLLPTRLTALELGAHGGHSEPSKDVRAYRLLGWMVAERIAQNALEKKFEFGVERVGPLHEACLITESETRDDLFDPLSRLHRPGYVEYLGLGDKAVTKPGLTIRLTPAGVENAGRLPVVHQASANFSLGSRVRSKSKEIQFPPGATVRQIEKVIIRTVDREMVRQNLEHHGGGIVDLTEVLLLQLDAVLEPQRSGDNQPPIDDWDGRDLRPALETLRATLREFRIALAAAVTEPGTKAKSVVSWSARLFGTLATMNDITMVRVPIVAAQAMGIYLVMERLGISIDFATVFTTMLGAGEAGRVADKVTGKTGGQRT